MGLFKDFGIDFQNNYYDEASIMKLRYEIIRSYNNSPRAIQLDFKLGYNSEHSLPHFLEELKDSEVKYIKSNIPLKKVLKGYDGFIFEIPSTTTVEAITSHKEIILLADLASIDLTSWSKNVLKKGIVLCTNTKEFKDILMKLFNGDFSYKRNNFSYMSLFSDKENQPKSRKSIITFE